MTPIVTTDVPMNQKNTMGPLRRSDDQEPTAVGAVGDPGLGSLGSDGVDLGGGQLEMAALALLADEWRNGHAQRSALSVIGGQQPLGELRAQLGSSVGEVCELAIDVTDLGPQRFVGETQTLPEFLLAVQMSGELVVDCRLRFERLQLVDVEFVDLPADRVGLLTQASVLNLSAPTWGVAPILRGKYVRDVVLCQPPPPPPANIPPLPSPEEVSSERERLETHSTNAQCSGCHVAMDPIGFGFERYDVIGATREVDLYGAPLTGAGALHGYAPEAFTGPAELAARLHDLPEARRCVVQQAWRYAGGRSIESYDTASLDPLAAAFAEAPRFVDLIASIATSPGFAEARMPEGVCQ